MKYILQKGVAGLGNRLQVLGKAVDMAEETGRTVVPDWFDDAWMEGFNSCFAGFEDAMFDVTYNPRGLRVFPKPWNRENIVCRDAKKALPDTWQTAYQAKDIPEDADIAVFAKYNAKYSRRLFDWLDIRDEVVRYALSWLADRGLKPGQYRCWHIRHTDKKSNDQAIHNAWSSITEDDVVITDNAEIAEWGMCPSFIIPREKRGGLHHQQVDPDTKRRINKSAVADMVIGGLAGTFVAVTPHSSYSQFIERGRKDGYWNRALRRFL